MKSKKNCMESQMKKYEAHMKTCIDIPSWNLLYHAHLVGVHCTKIELSNMINKGVSAAMILGPTCMDNAQCINTMS